MQNGIVSRENISQDTIATIFTEAFFDIQADDEQHVIRDSYRTWIKVDSRGRYVRFQTLFLVDPKINELTVLRALNKLNLEFILFKTFTADDCIGFQYYYWVEGGVSPKGIVHAYKFFANTLPELLTELSEQNILQ